MKKRFLLICLFLASATIVFALAGEKEIIYPVAELSNCQDKADCKNYCNQPENFEACFVFAKNNDLLKGPLAEKSEAEIKQFAQVMANGGPGDCRDQEECETYCDDINHIEECVMFAEENNFLEPEELAEAKQVVAALKKGAKMPGDCRRKEECEAYCFADDLQIDRLEECISFASAAGFMSEEEAIMVRKTGGKGPGNCRGKDECDSFCDNPDNFSVCIDFAEEHGLINPKEAEMARKTGGKGPGGCRGKEECDAFCEKPDNEEACFQFVQDNPELIPEEDRQRMEEGRERFSSGKADFGLPPEVADCVGTDLMEQVKQSHQQPPVEFEEKIKSCFEQLRTESGPGPMPVDVPSSEGDWQPPNPPSAPPDGEWHDEDEFREEFNQQFKQSFQEEFQRQYEQFSPPEGFNSEQSSPIPEQFNEPPPPPPPPPSPAPEARLDVRHLLKASVLDLLLRIIVWPYSR